MGDSYNCPVCGGQARQVDGSTLKHHVKNELLDRLGSDNYYVCMNGSCPVVYFKEEEIFYQENLRWPVWFKNNLASSYICFCNKVSRADIIRAIEEEGARNMRDIIRLTGAMKNANCKVNNPLGICCGQFIEELLSQYVK